MASSLCEHEIQQRIRLGQAHLGYPPPQASIPDWLAACSQKFSLQAQLLGRGHKRSIQAAKGRAPAAQAGVGIAEVLRLQFQHQQARRLAQGLGTHLQAQSGMELGHTPGADRQRCTGLTPEEVSEVHRRVLDLPQSARQELTKAFREHFQVPRNARSIGDRITQQQQINFIELFLGEAQGQVELEPPAQQRAHRQLGPAARCPD